MSVIRDELDRWNDLIGRKALELYLRGPDILFSPIWGTMRFQRREVHFITDGSTSFAEPYSWKIAIGPLQVVFDVAGYAWYSNSDDMITK